MVKARPQSRYTTPAVLSGRFGFSIDRRIAQPARKTKSSAESDSVRLRYWNRSKKLPGMWLTKIDTSA